MALKHQLVVEFVGTFMLVLAITTSVPGGSILIPIGIGGTLMVMIFAGGVI